MPDHHTAPSGNTARKGPRNLVLLSDGTGNSSAKLMKTNVWRMYEALDLSDGTQLAMYDNGVGTSSLKPLALLGGAIGLGLKRNVRDLYMFACRNYRADSPEMPGDRLYAFGFSRGAFTIRVLSGLIESQGLITGAHGPELERLATWAYREYRRQYTGGLVRFFRPLRDLLLHLWQRGKPRYDKTKNTPVRMAFVGLWDTVDAYGLPLDEMTRGWDKWVWPLSMCERNLANVDKVCHAVALDDERHTFHPVLLNEADSPLHDHTDKETVTQVWFAGVHSNIGGGYPDDSLAHVPLRWMASEAMKQQLRLHPAITTEWQARADPYGPRYDSRAGIGAYYRYNPRSIVKLTNDRFADVSIPRPKIHHSALDRITGGRDDYSPIVLPERYAVVARDGTILEGASNPFEHPTQSASRCADQERAWNLVWVRRVLYFATVILTAILLLPPLIFTGARASAPGTLLARLGIPRPGIATAFIDAVAAFAPQMLSPWVAFYRGYPDLLAFGGLLLLILMVLSTRVQAASSERMRLVWAGIAAAPASAVVPSTGPTDIIFRLRSHPAYRWTFEIVTQRIFPFVFGVGTLLVLAIVAAGTGNRALFAMASASGRVCEEPQDLAPLTGSVTLTLTSWNVCQQTNYRLESGQTYRVHTAVPPGGWYDLEHRVETPAGFSSGAGPVFVAFLPFRRVLREQWFVPIARVGVFPSEHHPLNQEDVQFTPRVSGPLFLFVNDVALAGGWNPFYCNNDLVNPALAAGFGCADPHAQRAATITITRVDPGAPLPAVADAAIAR